MTRYLDVDDAFAGGDHAWRAADRRRHCGGTPRAGSGIARSGRQAEVVLFVRSPSSCSRFGSSPTSATTTATPFGERLLPSAFRPKRKSLCGRSLLTPRALAGLD